MAPVRRREVLSGFSAVCLSGIGGCVDAQLSANSPTQICEITVINQYPEQVRSTLKVMRGSEVLAESGADLDPPTQTTDTHNLPTDELPPKTGYVVTVTVADDEWNLQDEYSTDSEELDSTSIVWILTNDLKEKDKPALQLLTSEENASC